MPRPTKRLHTICGEVILADDDDKPPLDRYKTAVKSPDERVEVLVKSILQTGLKEIAKEPYITAAERRELKEALKKVEEIEPSLPNSNAAAGQNISNNEADGTINVNQGNGNMNINPGSGQIFDGAEFQNLYFGVQPPAPRQL
ncbi:hypothetical protein QBC37DRAFT_374739 [Rhypophila decipiens]|uniref:Uncharacterized protein n=1 Tax=Rhypophila decipiens TaxID=261697 RepID=A0AAN7B712_9PEZI|nr:hypothetical protein QBC37DRAFT_374739 [Rhypophila decipiens]